MKQGYIMLEDKLKGEYKAAFEKVEMYSTTNLIGADADGELMMELLDHMLTAQESGQPVSQIVGDDIDAFCKNFFSEYNAKDRLFDFLKMVYRLAWILLAYELFDMFLIEENGGLFGSGDIGCVLIGAACGIVVNTIIYVLIRPIVQKSKRIKASVFNVFLIVLLIATMVGTMFTVNEFSSRYSISVPRWISLTITVVYIIAFMIAKARKNYKKFGTVKEPKEETISFKAGIKESMEDLPADWLKQFEKKNARRNKRGKEPLTEEKFLAKLDKQYDYRKVSLTNYIIFGVCSAVAIVSVALEGNETVLDLVIFGGILAVIEGGLCYVLNKSSKVCSRIYHKMRERMQEENLTLSEYVEKYLHITPEKENE
ncbi:MAG: hypothetical protein J5972_04130 [Eubacterium sp.]|nr:hypothetical protein [Eubacterium sp.]